MGKLTIATATKGAAMRKQLITMLLPITVLWVMGFRFDLVHMDFINHTITYSDGHTLYYPHMYWSIAFGAVFGGLALIASAYSILAGYAHSPKKGKAAAKAATYHIILLFVIMLYTVLLWQIIVDFLHALVHTAIYGR